MYQGKTITRYNRMPGTHIVRRRAAHSRRSPTNKRMMKSARNGATGPLARVATAPKKYRSNSQNFLPVSYQAYQPNIPIQNGAASCISVEAPLAKLTIPTQEAVISAASRCPPGLKRRMCRKIRIISANVAELDGSRADQSETPNSLKKLMARQ